MAVRPVPPASAVNDQHDPHLYQYDGIPPCLSLIGLLAEDDVLRKQHAAYIPPEVVALATLFHQQADVATNEEAVADDESATSNAKCINLDSIVSDDDADTVDDESRARLGQWEF